MRDQHGILRHGDKEVLGILQEHFSKAYGLPSDLPALVVPARPNLVSKYSITVADVNDAIADLATGKLLTSSGWQPKSTRR